MLPIRIWFLLFSCASDAWSMIIFSIVIILWFMLENDQINSSLKASWRCICSLSFILFFFCFFFPAVTAFCHGCDGKHTWSSGFICCVFIQWCLEVNEKWLSEIYLTIDLKFNFNLLMLLSFERQIGKILLLVCCAIKHDVYLCLRHRLMCV